MRKSERIRQLELTLVGMQYEIEMLKTTLDLLLEGNFLRSQDLDSGKWYNSQKNKKK